KGVVAAEPFQRVKDMELAIQLAVDDAHKRAAGRPVRYVPLNDSDASGATSASVVEKNADDVAGDAKAAVYIGDFNSGPTQLSLSILTEAGVPQISPTASRVGPPQSPDDGDTTEPAIYQRHGKTFVRLYPTSASIAKALLIRMDSDGCEETAMINDDTSY